ncbi:hypothetical protein [Bartonella sp. B1099]|uniref:hypothetical protein n=1 Tax=Bartonella sp. B1099 TaxID=2911422 RepID=UPI0020C38C32|nr:hypothetical protein [Bartonella sp. B1099]
MDAFENRQDQDELKGDGKDENFFISLRLCILPKLDCLVVSDINKQEKDTPLCARSY